MVRFSRSNSRAALILVTFPEPIARIYSTDGEVVTIAVQLLFLAAVFQLSDGLQVSASGALRGLKDTRGPMVVTVVAYWLLGLPAGYWLCFERGLGPRGLWIGIICGLTTAGLLLAARFRRLARGVEEVG